MNFLLTKTFGLIYLVSVLQISLFQGQPYLGSDSIFHKTKVFEPPCSSLLDLKAVNITLFSDSLVKTLSCLEKSNLPKTEQSYQEILQLQKIIQSNQGNLIVNSIQDKMLVIKFNLEKDETFIKYSMLGFIVWYLPLILSGFLLFSIIMAYLDYSLALSKGDL